tara:strand:- start:12429 stop:13217 length:789 start_codon:yes stop_codon:yes gene_type:complete
MTGLELAIISGVGQALLKGGLSAAGQFGSAQDLKLTPEQQKRLRELERMQARNALGMTQGERELYRSQAMTPVQAAEREVMARFGAAQNIADIGQGAAFRQQQAMADAGQAARGQVSQAVAQRDADVAQQQAEEKARLEEQQRQAKALERQAALSLVGGIGEAALGATGVVAEKKSEQERYEEKINRMRDLLKIQQGLSDQGKQTSQSTQNMLQISPQMEAVQNTKATDDSLGGDGNRAGEFRVPSLNPFEALLQKMIMGEL